MIEIYWPMLCLLLGFGGMEFVAWAAHKYVMHGPLWFIHKDHHTRGRGFWQRNDLFILLFATPSFFSIYYGLRSEQLPLTLFGFGILLYGIAYAVVHELIVHRRLNILKTPQSRYLQRVVRQHQKHHQSRQRDGGCFFGLLWPHSDL